MPGGQRRRHPAAQRDREAAEEKRAEKQRAEKLQDLDEMLTGGL